MDALWQDELLRSMLSAFLGGLATGALLVYLWLRPSHARQRELQREVERLEGELRTYREEVNQHFRRTSDLFQTLTASYRAFYDHLAAGAQSLCREERVVAALDLPETRLLATGEAAAAGAARDAAGGAGRPAAPGSEGPGERAGGEGEGRPG